MGVNVHASLLFVAASPEFEGVSGVKNTLILQRSG